MDDQADGSRMLVCLSPYGSAIEVHKLTEEEVSWDGVEAVDTATLVRLVRRLGAELGYPLGVVQGKPRSNATGTAAMLTTVGAAYVGWMNLLAGKVMGQTAPVPRTPYRPIDREVGCEFAQSGWVTATRKRAFAAGLGPVGLSEVVKQAPLGCAPAPSWRPRVTFTADLTNVVTADWHDLGIRIELCWRLRFNGPGAYGAAISRRRQTKSGSEGKPTHLLTLMADEGESPSDLLRKVADLLDLDHPIEAS
ncbi:MAG: hypothetical protein LC798_03240 [Chloroflexi bacterium]|nr:hypothetical protein [Chloroflexota bacterium]